MGAFGKTMMDTYVDEAGYVPIQIMWLYGILSESRIWIKNILADMLEKNKDDIGLEKLWKENLELRAAGWLAAYAPRMLHVKDVNAMVLWNFHGVRMQNE